MRPRWLTFCLLCILLSSFLLEFWPLALVSTVGFVFVGRGWLSPFLGLLLDLAYGTPVGAAAYAFFPFTLLGLAVLILRYIFGRYFLERASRDTL